MNCLGLFLIILFAVTASKADVLNARGATARRHVVEPPQVDIEDVIRAEQDPDFLEFLKDRERQKKAEEAAALNYKKQRQADETAYEKARIQFIKNRNVNVVSDESKEEEQYLKEQKAWEQQQEKLRREYVNNQQKEKDRLKTERMARIQKAFSQQQRMPASIKAPGGFN